VTREAAQAFVGFVRAMYQRCSSCAPLYSVKAASFIDQHDAVIAVGLASGGRVIPEPMAFQGGDCLVMAVRISAHVIGLRVRQAN